MGQAVEAGVVFSKLSMEGLMTSERIPSQFSVSMKVDKMLWNRTDSNIEPSAWKFGDASGAAGVVIARDDRDRRNNHLRFVS